MLGLGLGLGLRPIIWGLGLEGPGLGLGLGLEGWGLGLGLGLEVQALVMALMANFQLSLVSNVPSKLRARSTSSTPAQQNYFPRSKREFMIFSAVITVRQLSKLFYVINWPATGNWIHSVLNIVQGVSGHNCSRQSPPLSIIMSR